MTSFTIGGKDSSAEVIDQTSSASISAATCDVNGQGLAPHDGAPSDRGAAVSAHLSELAALSTVDRNASSPMSQQRAAQLITTAFRKSISIKSERYMLENGALWKKWSPETKSIDRLSKENISRLRKELALLSDHEKNFMENFTKQEFYGTHFTSANPINSQKNVAILYSRKKLINQKIDFAKYNTFHSDIRAAAHEDYVFLSLECGETEKKHRSRFGRTLLRFNIDTPQFSSAWLSLNDMVAPNFPIHKGLNHVSGLNEEDYDKIKKISRSTINQNMYLPGIA